MTLVEKVARAILGAEGHAYSGASLLASHSPRALDALQKARTAIEAMDPPTERMVAAMARCLPASIPENRRRDVAAEMWEAGVRAELADGGST